MAESFTYVATDANGNTTTGTITVNIIDDVPTAIADINSGIEGGLVTGNVLTGGTDDVFGADGATVPGGGVVGVRAAGGDLTDGCDDRDREPDHRALRHADAERGRQLQL